MKKLEAEDRAQALATSTGGRWYAIRLQGSAGVNELWEVYNEEEACHFIALPYVVKFPVQTNHSKQFGVKNGSHIKAGSARSRH